MVDQCLPLTVVVAAVLRDHRGRVLLARRPPGRHMEGLWELPGGKVGDGEGPARALRRELSEELGVEALIDAPMTFAVHEEPGLRILLLFFAATIVAGAPRPLEGQELRWVAPRELRDYPTPPADAAVLARISHRVS